MARYGLAPVVRRVRQLFGSAEQELLPDGLLLERFAFDRDESAFAALVERHGPMVRGVCRRVLGDPQDAEDAFQAVFLVLSRRVETVRADALAGWLYGVALRVARKARTAAARRLRRERSVEPPVPEAPGQEVARAELRTVLDEELSRLPEKYRAPLVLCYLEGRTKDEAAQQLGWPSGTVSGRMARARDLLRGRLARRGLALTLPLFATALAESAAPAAVPAAILAATTTAALRFAGQPGALTRTVSAPVAYLVQGVLRDMMLTKLKIAGGLLVAVAIVAAGSGLVRQGAVEAAPAPGAKADAPKADAGAAPKAISFVSHLHFEVFEFNDGINPRHLGATGRGVKVVTIPGGAEWYVSILAALPINNPAPGGQFGNIGGGGQFGNFGVAGGQFGLGGAVPGPGRAMPQPGGNAGFQGVVPGPGMRPPAPGAANLGGGGILGGAPGANPFGGPVVQQLGKGLVMPRLPAFTQKELTALIDELKKKDVPGLSIENRDFSDDDLAALHVLPRLQTLLLHQTKVTDAGLKSLAEFPALRTLILEGEDVTDAGVAHLTKIKNLKVLHLAKVKATDKALETLKECAGLESLLLMGCPEVTDNGLASLAGLENLKALRLLDMLHVGDDGLAALKGMKALTTLQLEWCPEITDKGMEILKKFYQVERLRLTRLNLTADGLAHLKGVPGLKKLELLYQDLSAGPQMGFGALGGVAVFGRSVYMPDESPAPTREKSGKLTDAILQGLKETVGLEELALGSDELTNDGLAPLAGLHALKKLHLGGQELTGAAFKQLKELTDLTVVDLVGVTSKEESVAANAGQLKGLTKLEKLQVSAFLSKAESAKVTRALAKVKIEPLQIPPVDGIRLAFPNPVIGGGVGGFGGGGIGGFGGPAPAR